MRVYDCSNSLERPRHRSESYGPPENDVMRYLKENADTYEAVWVRNPEKADVIMTNDVFPEEILALKKPMVKRMDGIFWQREEVSRNIPLNKAAQQADIVIFISEYSANTYFELYGEEINHRVVLNWIDPGIFRAIPQSQPTKYIFAAAASNWERREKRLVDLLRMARRCVFDIKLIGHVETPLPPNVKPTGYLSSPAEIAQHLNLAEAFINLSYRDPAPKVVAQAIGCGLPVLYADSGGTRELVGSCGVGIPDDDKITFSTIIPGVHYEVIFDAFLRFFEGYTTEEPGRYHLPEVGDSSHRFTDMLDGYYDALRVVARV